MDRRAVILFLAKSSVLYLVFFLLWQVAGLSQVYHGAVAAFLSIVYPHIDPTGAVSGVIASKHDMVFRLVVGDTRFGLAINGVDITSNTAMLLALYFASPIRGHGRVFAVLLSASMVFLFLVHAITLVTASQEALMTHPGIMATAPFSAGERWWVPRYNAFYEEMGMYLYVLLLWLPYIAWRFLEARRSNGDGTAAAKPPDN
jgi:hypothetical protein